MSTAPLPDYYEIMQLSPQADQETIERVFRHLAKRYHPDNLESGSTDRFTELMTAFRVLSDVEQRAKYDVSYQATRENQWRIFNQESATSDQVIDSRIRLAMLSILYTARRNSSRDPGVGIVELERLLGCPQDTMSFHIWYMRESGWIQRLESGQFAITVAGIDRLFDLGGPSKSGTQLLIEGNGAAQPTAEETGEPANDGTAA